MLQEQIDSGDKLSDSLREEILRDIERIREDPFDVLTQKDLEEVDKMHQMVYKLDQVGRISF